MKTSALHFSKWFASTLWAFVVFGSFHISLAQNEKFTHYTGQIVDAQNKSPLASVNLFIEGTHISGITNNEGKFSIKVPDNQTKGYLLISTVGYVRSKISIDQLKKRDSKIELIKTPIELNEISIIATIDPNEIVRKAIKNKGAHSFEEAVKMTAFYRERIKKHNKNLSLAEAVVSIYKRPNTSLSADNLSLIKARKSTNYSPRDTLALKLQGGPYNPLYLDIVKYTAYIFDSDFESNYNFKYIGNTKINDNNVYRIAFEQKPFIEEPYYFGELYIDAKKLVIVKASFSLNLTNREKTAQLFVEKKPKNADVWPVKADYKVDYLEKDGRWYYGYSNLAISFKVNWSDKFFNSTYDMTSEMAVTDWEEVTDNEKIKHKDRVSRFIILSEETKGFEDPEFWGPYNIIEPDNSIESAIKKIRRQLRKLN